MYNVDGTPNEQEAICNVVNVVLQYQDHTEQAQFTVTGLGKSQMILGLSWLHEHNPEVDWATSEVKMSCCSSQCCTCENKVTQKHKIHKASTIKVCTCWVGPLPDSEVDQSDIPDKYPDLPDLYTNDDSANDNNRVEEPIEDGNHILITTISPQEEFIQALSTMPQCLAEAFHRNTEPKSFCDSVLTYLHDFKDIFSKSSFDALPTCKPWDHVIELVPDANPVNCKVYPLAPNEQKELDEFILGDLQMGCICPSKLPMASPVFFIKKKDGRLHIRVVHSNHFQAIFGSRGKQHYEVESILDSRLKAGRLEFLVNCKGYGYENSWVSEHDVSAP